MMTADLLKLAVLKGYSDILHPAVYVSRILCVPSAHPGDSPVVSQPGDRDGL